MTVYLKATKRHSKTEINKVVKKKGNFKFSQIFYILLSVIILLGITYGFITNMVVTAGYNIKMTENKLNKMKDKNDELKIKLSELKSVKILEDKIAEMEMVEPQGIEYIRVGHEIALKN